MFPTIYVVDDEPAMRDSLEMLLASTGYRAQTFADAETFSAAFDPEAAGCVILDVRMPRTGGLEVLRWLRESGSAVPVIMISGHADVPTATRALLGGASDFIEKPFSDQRLVDRINESVRWQEQNREQERLTRDLRHRYESLSPREQQVLEGLVKGDTSAAISDTLGLSRRTVEMHRATLMKKMQAESVPELTIYAVKLGIAGNQPTKTN